MTSHKKTYANNVAGFSTHKLSLLTWKFKVVRHNYTSSSPNLFLYFRHVGQLKFDDRRQCVSFKGGYSISSYDPRWLHLSTGNDVYNNQRCSLNDTDLTCQGELKIAIGFKARFYVAAVYECTEEVRPYLDLSYNFTIIPHDDVHCRNMSADLQDVTPTLAKEQLQECLTYYTSYSPWNPQGFTIPQIAQSYATFLRFLRVSLGCYQHAVELLCRLRLPQCQNRQPLITCHDMCDDVNKACRDVFKSINFHLSCNSHAPRRKSSTCTYVPVVCTNKPIPPVNGYVSNQYSNTTGSKAYFKCHKNYQLHGPKYAVCKYSSQWETAASSECRNITHTASAHTERAVAISISTVVVLIAISGAVLHYFRYEVSIIKHCLCPSCCASQCACSKQTSRDCDMLYHAFIACDDDRRLELFVHQRVQQPLQKLGYRVCADHTDALVNVPPLRYIPEAIARSHRIIVILNEAFLASSWCQFTLEESMLQHIEGDVLKVVVILMQDKRTLKKVPRFLRSFLRTRRYIHIDDPLLMTKLRYELPDPRDERLIKLSDLDTRDM